MPKRILCERCGQPLKAHESISVTNVGLRCYPCFNEETAALVGVEFDQTRLQPVTVADADGVEHTFEFRSMLVPTGHALHARERLAEGRERYEFSVLGDFEADVWDLFKVLYERIRHELAVRHVERGELGWRITDARRLTGRIAWDSDRPGEVPRLIIDGRPFTWDQVGRMLMAFEGFTLRAVVDDTIEVVGGPGWLTPDGWCEVAVADNGIGFEPRHAERIFQMFERLHGRDAFEGTGTGLALCRRIAERHGGGIRAEGRPGEGARFTTPASACPTRCSGISSSRSSPPRRNRRAPASALRRCTAS